MAADRIDVLGLARDVWRGRRIVALTTAATVAVGLFAAIFGEVKYRVRVVVVPQTGRQMSGGNLQGLAAMAGMAGIDLSGADGSGGLPPALYPMVAASVPFQKELMSAAVPVAAHAEEVTLLDYFTGRGYRPFSLFPFIVDHTVGLPRTVLGTLRGKRATAETIVPRSDMVGLTARESVCMRQLARLVTVDVNEKSGYIAIEATMPEALMAAAVARRTQELLQEYVTLFKVQKVRADLDFIEKRYEEVRVDFEARRRALAEFQDSHRDITSALARTRESRLEDEYRLAFSLYSELASRREEARIAVKEDTPEFTVVEPATVPFERAAPRRARIAAASLVAGLVLGAALALVLPAAGWAAPRGRGKKKAIQ